MPCSPCKLHRSSEVALQTAAKTSTRANVGDLVANGARRPMGHFCDTIHRKNPLTHEFGKPLADCGYTSPIVLEEDRATSAAHFAARPSFEIACSITGWGRDSNALGEDCLDRTLVAD